MEPQWGGIYHVGISARRADKRQQDHDGPGETGAPGCKSGRMPWVSASPLPGQGCGGRHRLCLDRILDRPCLRAIETGRLKGVRQCLRKTKPSTCALSTGSAIRAGNGRENNCCRTESGRCASRGRCMSSRDNRDLPMTPIQKHRLEAAGHKVGSAAEFLGLSKRELELVNRSISLRPTSAAKEGPRRKRKLK